MSGYKLQRHVVPIKIQQRTASCFRNSDLRSAFGLLVKEIGTEVHCGHLPVREFPRNSVIGITDHADMTFSIIIHISIYMVLSFGLGVKIK